MKTAQILKGSHYYTLRVECSASVHHSFMACTHTPISLKRSHLLKIELNEMSDETITIEPQDLLKRPMKTGHYLLNVALGGLGVLIMPITVGVISRFMPAVNTIVVDVVGAIASGLLGAIIPVNAVRFVMFGSAISFGAKAISDITSKANLKIPFIGKGASAPQLSTATDAETGADGFGMDGI